MIKKKLSIKIDVDTHRGTQKGCLPLAKILMNLNTPATWLWSLGKDNTGRAIIRIFKSGFLKKVSRTSIIEMYGLKTLLNGTLLPAPHIGKQNKHIMKKLDINLFEHGIHCWDHTYWQDFLNYLSPEKTLQQLQKAQDMFVEIFGKPANIAGAPSWQANANSLQAYDTLGFNYSSDTRVGKPFIPMINGKVFKNIQIPSNLPTLDELIGRPEYPLEKLNQHLLNCMQNDINIMTIHAEIEGIKYLEWFEKFIKFCLKNNIEFIKLSDVIKHTKDIPIKEMINVKIDGRSGVVAAPRD